MFKRLIIAVFALGMTLALSGTAISDVDKQIAPGNSYDPTNESHARYSQTAKARNVQLPSQKFANSSIKSVAGNPSVPANPPSAACSFIAHHNGSLAFFWQLPDYFGAPFDVTLPSVRFTAASGERCTLKTGSVLVYLDATVGNPGLKVYLYDDDGFGFPGSKLDSVTFPQGSFSGTGLVWADADFSPAGWVFEDGDEYHITASAITDSPDDSLGYLSDNGTGHAPATTLRNNVYLAGGGTDVWTAFSDIFVTPTDYGFFIEAEACCAPIPFTDCYSQNYDVGTAFFWAAPHAVFGDSAYAMRFSVGGPETLASVTFPVFNATASGSASKGSAYVFGDDALHVTVYDDDGFGFPGTALAQVIVPGSTYPAFPATVTVPFAPLVLTDEFHVGLASSGTAGLDCEAFLSDNGGSASGRGTSAWNPGVPVWETMLIGWGADVAFKLRADLCRDQFSNCSITTPFTGFSHVYPVPETVNGNTRWGQKFTAVGANCEIRDVQLTFAWASTDAARATRMYTKNTRISVHSDVAGLPGPSLGFIDLTPADYAAFGNVGFTGATYLFTGTIDFAPLTIQLAGDYWLVVEALTAVRDSGIRIALALTAGGAGFIGNGATFSTVFGNQWYIINAFFGGVLPDAAVSFVSEHCCIPFNERACAGASDWTNHNGNPNSDGLSQVSLSDAWCDLNRLWSFTETDASAATQTAGGPLIYEGKVVAPFHDNFKKFDLASGALEATWGPSTAGLTAGDLGTNLHGPGAIATLTGGTEVLFLPGGTNNNVVAINWNTNVELWSVPLGPNQGVVRGGAFMVLNIAGTDVLFYTTQSGNVVARVAATGALYGGWGTNPVSLGGNASEITGATDGTSLYFGTNPVAPNNGTVAKVTAATGAIVWTVPAVNLKGTTVYPASSVTREIFAGGVATDGTNVFAVSTIAAGNFPADGVYYKLSAGTGVVDGFSVSERTLRGVPILDANRVLAPVFSRWGGGSLGHTVTAFAKAFSTIDYSYTLPDVSQSRGPAALSCEPGGVGDLLIVTADNGWVAFVNADNGDEIFRRRWDDGTANNIGRGVAIGNGPYVAVNSRNQSVFALGKGVDRPRLEFQSYNYVEPVEFGTNPALPINLGPNIVNTGCLPLSITTSVADENPFTAFIPNFSIEDESGDEAMRNAERIADILAGKPFSAKGVVLNSEVADGTEMSISGNDIERRENRNRAASAVPPWLVSITHPAPGDVIAPGDTQDLEIVVDQNLISRGPQVAYFEVGSNDPDFFLNDPLKKPQFKVTLVGGCLTDTSGLQFGVGASNLQLVFNHGRIGDGDLAPSHGFDIDGADVAYFQGSYVLAVSQRRWAVNTPEWFSNVDDELISLQADPNWCDTTCKPFLVSPYNVGAMSTNGITYTPIDANMICRSYIDSVQNFFTGSAWDVTLYSAAPFDNDSTMGLYVRSRVVGAVDEPLLANVTVDLMTVTERNNRAVPGFFWGSMNDFDLGGGDTVGLDQSISTAYAWRKTGANGIWGQIKLPFGCGQTPTINTHGLGGAQGFFAGGGVGLNAYFDTMYTHMLKPSGSITSQAAPNASDFEQHNTFFSRNIAAGETFELGIAHFGFPNLSNGTTTITSAPATVKSMARLVNKWTGWGRGDVNNDNNINLADIVYLAANVNFAGPGPIPFAHLGDVDNTGTVNQADVTYLTNYYFNCGPCPLGAFVF